MKPRSCSSFPNICFLSPLQFKQAIDKWECLFPLFSQGVFNAPLPVLEHLSADQSHALKLLGSPHRCGGVAGYSHDFVELQLSLFQRK